MLKGISRAQLVGAWFAAVAVMIATSVVSGAAITISRGGLWLAACVVPAAVMLLVWRGASPVTCAPLLHSVNRPSKEVRP
jgi:hypothetical protein